MNNQNSRPLARPAVDAAWEAEKKKYAALPDATTQDMRMLRDILLIGGEGEPLVISSELETGLDGFGDTLMRFEVRNPEGRSRYGVCVTVTRLRIDALRSS